MRKYRILIVEDDEAIGKMIAMNLKIAGYETVLFNDGDKACGSFKEDHRYDLAVLDIMVPGKNGFEIMEMLKPYDVPVIFLTAKADIDSKIQGLSGGAEDYIVKPFEILELLIRIEKVLDRTKKGSLKYGLHLELVLPRCFWHICSINVGGDLPPTLYHSPLFLYHSILFNTIRSFFNTIHSFFDTIHSQNEKNHLYVI